MITKDDLIAFEKEVAHQFEAGKIHAPIHLGSGNEDQLLELFKSVSPDDWKLCTWRNHLHALLSGIPPDEVMRQILAGKSMSINSVEHRFYSSAIAGGILPIAVGLGMAIKRFQPSAICGIEDCCHCRCKDLRCTTLLQSNEDGGHLHYQHYPCPAWSRKVFCFVGDMTAATGGFEEATKYAWNFRLPVTFIIEDNGKSVQTPTKEAWGNPWPYEFRKNVIYYKYELTWPHHGTGIHVAF